VRPLFLDHGTFDDHMIDLPIIVCLLSFVLEIGVGASGDRMDHAMGGEIVGWLRRLTYL
jgi:hypothetical protein